MNTTMPQSSRSNDAYDALRQRGLQLAGELSSLVQRACVYHHMYRDSGGRNVFPLIAAHGALWASGYFRKGSVAGNLLSLRYLLSPSLRTAKLNGLAVFANKFRDINRRVCAESFAIYFGSKSGVNDEFLVELIGAPFLGLLKRCHAASEGARFSADDRAALFHAFFDWEQRHIVVPAVAEAYATFDWSAIKRLALVPNIDFSYFERGDAMKFADFSDQAERIQKGLIAYRKAEDIGLHQVERALMSYGVMPADFLARHTTYFQSIAAVGASEFTPVGGGVLHAPLPIWPQ